MPENNGPKTSQLVGGLIGAAIGNYQGTMVGGALALGLMSLPISGPLVILAIPAVFLLPCAGALAGAYFGAKVGSQGIDHAVMMSLGELPKAPM